MIVRQLLASTQQLVRQLSGSVAQLLMLLLLPLTVVRDSALCLGLSSRAWLLLTNTAVQLLLSELAHLNSNKLHTVKASQTAVVQPLVLRVSHLRSSDAASSFSQAV
jgi:hypothetical protein